MNPIESFASASFTQALYWASGALFAGCLGMFALAALADSRTIADENVWIKPSRFSVSLALHYATMAVATGWLSKDWREDRTLRVVGLVSVACGIFELTYIAVQAARHQRSHFNTSTPFYAVMYGLMAIGAVGVLVPAGAIGVAAALDADFTAGSVMRASVALGMIGGTVLTLVTAFRLGGNGSHFIGTHPPGGRRVPFFRWSLATGDLRPPHFLATHMIQAIPLFGLCVSAIFPLQLGLLVVASATVFWVWATLKTFRLALAGRPVTAVFA